MAHQDIAVTGIGLVTPAGIGVAENWADVCAGRPTAALDPEFDDLPVRISCRVPGFDADHLLGARRALRLAPFVRYALVAAEQAVADAGLGPGVWDAARVGVVLGCGSGGLPTYEEQHRVLLDRGASKVSPLLMPVWLPNMLSGQVAMQFQVTGPNFVVTTACASGATAIGTARDLLLADRCDIVITGGSEASLSPLIIAGFAKMGALSTRNEDPAAASRPFDAERDGFVAAEGSGVLILERAADAAARGARARARIVGYGASADAHHITAPHPEGRGIEAALLACLADAGAAPHDVDHVNAHGTSTPLNDLAEATMLRRVLDHGPLVTSTKGVTGHLFAAAGAIEAIYTVLAVQHGLVPPTANLKNQDPAVDIAVAAAPAHRRIELAVSNSFGFGGQNAVLAVAAA